MERILSALTQIPMDASEGILKLSLSFILGG